ncbi:MAG: pro-sigmaK processing inhibitor BofA family protein [Firmicutes bacterium]|nr:pro-sigmaK processing inhibitor BofA family protein [Bacillota bacterium]
MNEEIAVYLAYVICFFTIVFFRRVIFVTLRVLWGGIVKLVTGAGVIAFLNIIGSYFSFAVPFNTFNALIVGILGIPGAIFLLLFLN